MEKGKNTSTIILSRILYLQIILCNMYTYLYYFILGNRGVWCPNGCGKLYNDYLRMTHMKEHVDHLCGDKLCKCPLCPRKFTSNFHMQIHMILSHGK